MNKKFYKFILSLFFSFALNAFTQDIDPKTLVSMGAQVYRDGKNEFLVLTFNNATDWHTYWKNPGDAGIPIEISFFQGDKEVKLNALEWPMPHRFIGDGDIWGYGYRDTYALVFTMSSDLGKQFLIKGKWLVCKNLCLSGQQEIKGKKIYDSWSFSQTHDWSNDKVAEYIKTLPVSAPWPNDLELKFSLDPGQRKFFLDYRISDFTKNEDHNVLYPFPTTPLGFKHEVLGKISSGNADLQMMVEWEGDYLEPPLFFPDQGIFEKEINLKFLFFNKKSNRVEIIEKNFSSVPLVKQNGDKSSSPSQMAPSGSINLIYILIMAFLGGMILNLMPCVLPMVSLKTFELIKLRESSKKEVMLKNIFYCLGIIFSLQCLAVTIILIKHFGGTASWGMQLQSPLFICVISLILFIFALNLFGLFEFATPGGSFLGSVKLPTGVGGDFFSGIISTILSTPCSAPFLGTALSFALSSSAEVILIVFFAIGLGLGMPFIMIAFAPKLLVYLPRPGLWMEKLKKILGLALILTLLWLQEVFLTQIMSTKISLSVHTTLMFSFLLIFSGLYFKKDSGKLKIIAGPFIMLGMLTFFFCLNSLRMDSIKESAKDLWSSWSEEKLALAKNDQKWAFIDFTAKWCFNCKVNEKLVLHTKSFSEMAQKRGIVLLEADWTSYDPIIGKWLEKQKVFGIPAYFLQHPNGSLIYLGETTSVGEVEKVLDGNKSP